MTFYADILCRRIGRVIPFKTLGLARGLLIVQHWHKTHAIFGGKDAERGNALIPLKPRNSDFAHQMPCTQVKSDRPWITWRFPARYWIQDVINSHVRSVAGTAQTVIRGSNHVDEVIAGARCRRRGRNGRVRRRWGVAATT